MDTAKMMESLIAVLSSDAMQNSISMLAFVLSVGIWVRTLWHEAIKVTLKIDHENPYGVISTSNDVVTRQGDVMACIPVLVECQSSRSISVTQIELRMASGEIVTASTTPHFVGHIYRRMIDGDERHYERFLETVTFPVVVGGDSVTFGFFQFCFKSVSVVPVTAIKIHTSKKAVLITNKATLAEFSKFLQTNWP